MHQLFTKCYPKIIVNEKQIDMVRNVFAGRKGPVIFVPTHRSYIDFLVVSTLMYFYGMELPLICSGEDFLGLGFVGDILRGSGAFFMRRTFKNDDLYKSIFYEYVQSLTKRREIMEFFVEGTRSRTNKILAPKYGFMSICTKVFFEKEVEDIIFVPVTINYTRTFESESFLGELRGEQKVSESISRIFKAVEVLSMNFGTMYVDFCDPMSLAEFTRVQYTNPDFKPFENKAH